MKGELDEVSLYNRALSPEENATIFKAGEAASVSPTGNRVALNEEQR
jgi:hypothetical protein